MIKNYKLSKALQEKYNHKQGFCFVQAKQLMLNKEIDKIVLGYSHNNSICYRHVWGIKNNRIVDSSEPDNKIYFEVNFIDNFINEYDLNNKFNTCLEDMFFKKFKGCIIYGFYDNEADKSTVVLKEGKKTIIKYYTDIYT
jgi:hypothetical protein